CYTSNLNLLEGRRGGLSIERTVNAAVRLQYRERIGIATGSRRGTHKNHVMIERINKHSTNRATAQDITANAVQSEGSGQGWRRGVSVPDYVEAATESAVS